MASSGFRFEKRPLEIAFMDIFNMLALVRSRIFFYHVLHCEGDDIYLL